MIDSKAAVMIGSALAGAIVFWGAVYGWGKWLNRPQPAPQPTAPDQDERLRRIEYAVEAIAHEVERLGEGQRFAAKMLNELEQRPVLLVPPNPMPARSITPH